MTSELVDGSIFLHVPKTGGMWVSQVLSEMGLIKQRIGRHPHTAFERACIFPNGKRRWKELGRAENWKPSNLLRPGVDMKIPFTFCFVRHPVRWYESWWRYLKGKQSIPWLETAINKEQRLKRWDPFSVPAAAFCSDFNEFVSRMLKAFPGYVTWMYGHYAVPESGFVGKQENLRNDLMRALTMRGLAFDVEHLMKQPFINEAGHKKESIQWDEGLLRDVQDAERSTMIRYNYAVLASDEMKTPARLVEPSVGL